nr:protein translocase subunit SECA2, chloroplastic isoform X2 [Ipomoea batatas]
MENPEPPECPVCLQPYDSVATIPRVLACGHSACEPCLAQLPNAFPDTLRCPACTQLPWLLPENSVSTESRNSGTKSPDDFCYLLYGCFRNHDGGSNRCSVEKEEVCLVKVGMFIDKNESCSKFKCSYEVKVLRVLYGMAEGVRNELELILNAGSEHRGACKVYGLWYNVDDNCVYLVCQRFQRSLSMLTDLIAGENGEEKVRCMTSWAMIGLGICEAVYNLHLQGLSIGCLGASCFGLDEFGHAYVDICETLIAGRRVGKMIAGKEDQNLSASLENENTVECSFVSPEAMFELLKVEACLLLWLLIGKPFTEEMQIYLRYLVTIASDKKGCDFVGWYTVWKERIVSLFVCKLGPNFISLREILGKCLDFNPENRPLVLELWKSLREVIVKPDFDVLTNLKQVSKKESMPHCLLFGDLCLSIWRTNKQSMGENQRKDAEEVEISKIDKDVVEGIPDGQVKCIDLKEHRDCITGFAIGGGFLFSSSFDKVVNVWSLQDYSHVHAFKGHEQRVTAVAFVDDEKPLCISGDNGGVICIWGASVPLGPEPIKKIYDQKDWRYSGIHALVVSASKYMYTGSGDKSIKAWSLQALYYYPFILIQFNGC